MNFFSSGIKSVLGSQQAAEQPSGAETVERLVERVLSSTLLEDRRDACRALKSLSRKYRVEVGAHGMSAFTYVLQTDYADCETVGYALEALCNITSDENFEEEEWQDTNYKPGSNLGAQFTEIFIKQPDNVGLVLSFLEEYDFRVRWPAVKLLKSLLSSKPKEVQDIVLVSPMGVSKLMDLLSDSREVIRNDALLLLLQLTRGNANIQKIVAFENAFDRLFDVINDEGYADGDIVVEDCLLLMLNLLKNNVSNQNFFKEGSYIQRLAPMFNILNDDELDVGLAPQKISNINAVLQIIRTLVSPANPGQAMASCQKALRAAGIVEKLCNILMAGGVPVDVLTETIITVAEVIRGNLSNQEYFASVMAPSTPPREAIVVLLMSMVNERQPFFLRCAVLYSFQCFLYRNELGQTKLIQTLLPSTSEQSSVTAGQLLCGGLFSHDVLSHWLSSVALSHALIENPAAKESMLRVLLTPVSGHTPLSLLHHVTLLLQQSNKVQSKLGLLILLATWLSHCPPAIRHFLSIDTSISYLTTQAGATEHDDNEELVQGLCAFIMGICTHFNDDSVPSFSKENLRQLINKRVGLEVFLEKLNEVSRHELYSRAVKHPNIRVNSPNDLLLDHEFCKLFKALEGLVMKAVTVTSAELTNGPSENIEQYKNLIREQDKRITELSMHYEALLGQNNQQAAKIQELTDQNLILKAQLSTTSAASQLNSSPSNVTHLVQEKDQKIARLEEELNNLRLHSHSHSENRPLSAAESQAVDSEVIYLKSQVQALQETEREVSELRKDQEDLLELVADQGREIETLKSQLRVYQEKEQVQKQEDRQTIKLEPEESQPEPEEKYQYGKISGVDAAKEFDSQLPPKSHADLSNQNSASPSPAPTPDLKMEPPLATHSFATPLSTPTPPTQISGSSRSTPTIFSPVPLPSPKPPSTGPPSPGPVTVPLSALSAESDDPAQFPSDLDQPQESTSFLSKMPPVTSDPLPPPSSSFPSGQSFSLFGNSQAIPLSEPNSCDNPGSIFSLSSSVFSPFSMGQQSGLSLPSPFSSFGTPATLPSGVSIFTPSSDSSQPKSEVSPFSGASAPPSTNHPTDTSVTGSEASSPPSSIGPPPPRMQPSPGASIFSSASSDIDLTKSETAPPLSGIGPPPKTKPLSGMSIFSPPVNDISLTKSDATPYGLRSHSGANQLPTGVSIFTPGATQEGFASTHDDLSSSMEKQPTVTPSSVDQAQSEFSSPPTQNETKSLLASSADETNLKPNYSTLSAWTDQSQSGDAKNQSFITPHSNVHAPQNQSEVSLFTPPNSVNQGQSENSQGKSGSVSVSSVFSPPSLFGGSVSIFTPTNSDQSEVSQNLSSSALPSTEYTPQSQSGVSIFTPPSSVNQGESGVSPNLSSSAYPSSLYTPQSQSGVSIFTPSSSVDQSQSEVSQNQSSTTSPSTSHSAENQSGVPLFSSVNGGNHNQPNDAFIQSQSSSLFSPFPQTTPSQSISLFSPTPQTTQSQPTSLFSPTPQTTVSQPNSFFSPTPQTTVSTPNSLFSPTPQTTLSQSSSLFSPTPQTTQSQSISLFSPTPITTQSQPISLYSPTPITTQSQPISLFSPTPITTPSESISPKPMPLFTPLPQPATYPYQQNSLPDVPHPIPPRAESDPSTASQGSIFGSQPNNSSPFSSLFPAAAPGNQAPPPAQPTPQQQQQGGLFSFMNPSAYFSSQSSSSGPQPVSIFSAPSSVMSNNIFPS